MTESDSHHQNFPSLHPPSQAITHRLVTMAGRDPAEQHRVSTPLELLFDLTFVVAFGVAAGQLSHLLAGGHAGAGIVAFGYATFAICLAWINFTWFASAYDTDDWAFRLMTMVQMVGVLILALGLPEFFDSIEAGHRVNNAVLVMGYVVMRIALVGQWLRASRQDPARRSATLTYVTVILIAQAGWIGTVFLTTSVPVTLAIWTVLAVFELSGPWLAETRSASTPWHPHHIAERYGLMAIIALGEGVVGTVATISAMVSDHGWSVDAVLLALSGTLLTFGMWWMYFTLPTAEVLHARRERAFWFGYGHMPIYGAIVATGSGLHTAAYFVAHHSVLGPVATVAAVAIPVLLFMVLVFGLYTSLMRSVDAVHVGLIVGTALVLAGAVALAMGGVPMAPCLLVVSLAPMVGVLGFELFAHRHVTADLDAAAKSPGER